MKHSVEVERKTKVQEGGRRTERERERELSLQRWYSAELVYPVKIQSFRLGR